MSDQKPFAIIQLAGKQYLVSQGDTIEVNNLNTPEGETITINDVLLYSDGKKKKIGAPVIKDASVKLKILSNFKDKKVRVATYKAKSRYRKVKGHRQHLTALEVTNISA